MMSKYGYIYSQFLPHSYLLMIGWYFNIFVQSISIGFLPQYKLAQVLVSGKEPF